MLSIIHAYHMKVYNISLLNAHTRKFVAYICVHGLLNTSYIKLQIIFIGFSLPKKGA